MQSQQALPAPSPEKKNPITSALKKALESGRMRRQNLSEYRSFIKHHYDGIAGNLTQVSGLLTGHALLAGQVFKPAAFDLRGCKRILDAGCGDGRYCKQILRRADPDAFVAAFDLSHSMLRRAMRRVKSNRVNYVSADMTHLPYPDQFFDAMVCGWVIEHLPDPRPALREFARVLQPGGKFLLMTTEDTFAGALCSSMWHCRTYNRREIQAYVEECGLIWHRPLYFSRLHRLFRIGGVIQEIRRPG